MTTRRSFLQSMAAMFALPIASINANYQTHDLTPWLDHETSRFDLSKPFDLDGFSIATDGRKIVRVPRIPSLAIDGIRKTPNAAHLPWDGLNEIAWKPFVKHRKATSDGTHCLLAWSAGMRQRKKVCLYSRLS